MHRAAVHGLRLLEGYRGIICDGYEAYKTMTPTTAADALSGTLACCWSHLRRRFVTICARLLLDDGRIEMDTNAVERAMRPIKLNAKNAMSGGGDEGAENWA